MVQVSTKCVDTQPSALRKKRIALLVPNPCSPDNRVIKLAHLLALDGHDVRVYCRARKGLPMLETIDGVTYVRRELSPLGFAADIWWRFLGPIFAPVLGPGAGLRMNARSRARARANNRKQIRELDL